MASSGVVPTAPTGTVWEVTPPTGSAATDTANIQAAINAAQAVGGTVTLQPGTYRINAPLSITNPVQLLGSGRNATILRAVAAIAQVINDTAVAPGMFAHFTIDGNGLAASGHVLNAAENSIPHVVFDVMCFGATGKQYVCTGCEDTTYIACLTSGNEAAPATVADAITVTVPNGAAVFASCQFFGQVELSAQQFTILGGAMGPLYLHAPGGAGDVINLDGVYLYDGGVHGRACITNADVGGLPNVSLRGCYLIAQTLVDFIVGAGMSGGGASVTADDCVFVQTASLPANPTSHILNATAGNLNTRGGGMTTVAGGTVLPATAGVMVNSTDNTGHARVGNGLEVTTQSGGGSAQALSLKDLTTAKLKSIRLAGANGDLQILNSAFSAVLLQLIDGGQLQILNGVSPGNFGALNAANQLWQGSGAPANANGANGDIYFRTDTPGTANQRVYVKNAGAWTGIS